MSPWPILTSWYVFIILEDTRNYSMESKQSQNKEYEDNNFKDGSNYSRANKMYSIISLQNTNRRARSQSNGLDYDKKNYIHSNSGNNF